MSKKKSEQTPNAVEAAEWKTTPLPDLSDEAIRHLAEWAVDAALRDRKDK